MLLWAPCVLRNRFCAHTETAIARTTQTGWFPILDADHKLFYDPKTRDSQYAVLCSSIAGISRRL